MTEDPRPTIIAALDAALEYFDKRADIEQDCPETANEEMRLHQELETARALYIAQVGDPSIAPASVALPPSFGHALTDLLRQHPNYWWGLSNRYSSAIGMFLLTPSLDIAVFNARRDLLAFFHPSTNLAEANAAIIPPPAPEPERRMGRMLSGPRSPRLTIDFDL